MGRPSFPHIGWDPTPGDVEQTQDLAKKLGGLATELGTALQELERIECGAWKGEAARAFAGHISEDVTPLIKKSHTSFDKAARALHRWAVKLQSFQDEADKLEKSAGHKLQALHDAQAQNKDDLSKESGAVNELENAVHDLEVRYAQEAARIGKELDKADDIAPNEPGFWHKLVHGVKDAWDSTVKWVQDHADVIKMIGDALSLVSAALGVLAIITAPFEPIGAIFATAAVITSGAALLTHLAAKAAGADVSWVDIGFDALGVLPGAKGLFGSAELAKGATAAARIEKLGAGYKAAKAGKLFVLFGPNKTNAALKIAEGGSRLRLAAEGSWQNVRMGQWAGTQGLNLATKLPFIKSAELISPVGAVGRSLDAGIKTALGVHKGNTYAKDDLGYGGLFHSFASG